MSLPADTRPVGIGAEVGAPVGEHVEEVVSVIAEVVADRAGETLERVRV